MVCIRCQKRPAIIFIQRMENGQMKQEGYCLHCARELHIKPVDDLMKQFGMSEQDLDNMENRMESMMEELGDSNPLSMLMNMSGSGEDADAENMDEDLVPGSNATFPLGFTGTEKQDGEKKADRKNGKKPPKRKFLDTYCENLTRKARIATLDDLGAVEAMQTGSGCDGVAAAMPLVQAMAQIAAGRLGTDQPRPAPFYLRGADAAPPSDPPPVILDLVAP